MLLWAPGRSETTGAHKTGRDLRLGGAWGLGLGAWGLGLGAWGAGFRVCLEGFCLKPKP